MANAILLVSCPDQKGLVARLGDFIYRHGGNIVHADHHTDASASLFLSRLEWELDQFDLGPDEIAPAFATFGETISADWEIHFSDVVPRMAVWVSRQDHCLLDLLWRHKAGELAAEVPLMISNHPDLEPVAGQFGIDFHHLPIDPDNKPAQEARQLELLADYRIDLVVLAKYMQILSHDFVGRVGRIINIHHSFLPAFAGASPYHRAHERGVKIIGATAHYVTAELDEGPIIEQDVVRVSHRDTVADLIRKGKDLERMVLARAVRYHLENRVLVYRNRTVVFA
ncbi:MAG: formyltetrahydrofolate deformylase [bacterium]|nr:formyltetrahydrofolate deformylase [bacterium]